MKNRYTDAELDKLCRQESEYHSGCIDLIAASNFLRPELAHLSNYRIHRSMEGLLGQRPYAGNKYFDKIEKIGVETAKKIFNAEHVNIQPHSGSQANQAAYSAFLNPGDTVLGMKFDSGGHLTHGNPANFSGKFYHFVFYNVDPLTQLINYREIEKKAKKYKPKMIVVGASSYPRIVDYKKIKKIADKYGSYLMVDIAHPIGLIAADKYPSPIKYADVVTASTEKTFWGPHAGIILTKRIYKQKIDKAVHPGTQSSVPMDRIIQIGKAMLFALTPEFNQYIIRIIENAKILECEFKKIPNCLLFGGTDCHFIVIDVLNGFGITGKEAEKILENIGIFTNRQLIPFDTKNPYITSGLRIGATCASATGYDKDDFKKIALIIIEALSNPRNKNVTKHLKNRVKEIIENKKS